MVKGVKGWVVDFTSTKHIGAIKEEISYYTPIKEGIECEYVGDNRSMVVCGKGKVLLQNPILVHWLGKTYIKVLVYDGIVTFVFNDFFVVKVYVDECLFVFNVDQTINENGSFICAYLVYSIDV